MKRWEKILIIIILCYISYYSAYFVCKSSLDEETSTNISLIFFILPIIIYFIVVLFIKIKNRLEDKKVLKVSERIKSINKLINDANFQTIIRSKRYIYEREYSRKSYDRARAKDIIFYHLDNNIDNIVNDIECSIENKKKWDNIIEQAKNIKIEIDESTINNLHFSKNKYILIEDRIISKILENNTYYAINVLVKVFYTSSAGKVNISKDREIKYQEIIEFYNEWKNGKKYATNARIERSILNDDIRYNVLKRDNYTCQICGATAKDGAKLHVDHIIPVSEGGKTTMSNLQTLCDRCNIGKSNKLDSDFENNRICPKCGAKLVKRSGKYGDFIGCSNYPKCHYKREIK